MDFQTIYAVVVTVKTRLYCNRRNQPTPSSQASQPTDASFATDQRNRRNRVSDNVQIIRLLFGFSDN